MINTSSASDRRLDVPRSVALIEALGGTTMVASIFGIAHPAVSAWKKRGIPESRLQYLQAKFKKIPAVAATMDFQPWTTRRC